MKIIDLYKTASRPVFSIEILPPRNGTDESNILNLVRELRMHNIGFVSITMGSDISLRGGSLALAAMIKSTLNIEVLAHCTCVRRSREEVENLLTECRYLGLENILALRGDPPQGEEKFTPHPDGHRYALEMIRQITWMNQGLYFVRPTDKDYDERLGKEFHRNGIPARFCIGAAGHPDGHPDCPDYEENFVHLRQKQDAGAQFIITQAFFHIDTFKRFMEKADKYGITIPVIPGLMPVMNPKNLKMVLDLFRVDIPRKFISLYEKNKDDPDEFRRIGMEQAVSLCKELLTLDIKGIQFFTLNRKGVIKELLNRITD